MGLGGGMRRVGVVWFVAVVVWLCVVSERLVGLSVIFLIV